jgi:hypothetical protein
MAFLHNGVAPSREPIALRRVDWHLAGDESQAFRKTLGFFCNEDSGMVCELFDFNFWSLVA